MMLATAPPRFPDMKKRPGRPPVDPEKRLGNPVEVRFTDSQRELIDSALPPDGSITRAEFIRAAAVKEAERIAKRRSKGE